MFTDQRLGQIAANLLAVRAARRTMFPTEIFDEHAWEILLRLFAARADGHAVSEADLLAAAQVPVAVGRRWLAHLVAVRHIEPRSDGDEVVMHPVAIETMRTFLTTAASIHAGE